MNKHMRRSSTSLVIRQMHIKAVMRYYFTPTDNIKRLTVPNIGKGRATGTYTVLMRA